jgi:fluoride exporter
LNNSDIIRILLVAAGGPIGSVLRIVISGVGSGRGNSISPWGTLPVSLAGPFLIGIARGLHGRKDIHPKTRLFLLIGIFGGFAMFSTFTFGSFSLQKKSAVNWQLPICC